MIEARSLERVLHSALTYTFVAHGYGQEEAVRLAWIAVEPCRATMEHCQRLIETTIDVANQEKRNAQ